MDQFALAAERLKSLRQLSPTRKRLQKRLEAGWLPTRCRDEGAIEEGALAIAQRLAIRAVHKSAGGEQHRVPRRRVPFARGRGARIDVRLALRDHAEFER